MIRSAASAPPPEGIDAQLRPQFGGLRHHGPVRTLERTARLGAAVLLSAGSVLFFAWSGGLAALILKTTDNAPSAWAAASATTAAIALGLAAAAWYVSDPCKIGKPLVALCASAWVLFALLSVLGVSGRRTLWALAGLESITSIAIVVSARRGSSVEPFAST